MSTDSSNLRKKLEPARVQFSVKIACKCGQVGSATLDENTDAGPRGSEPELLAVSSGFYLRVEKKMGFGRTEIVCGICEAVIAGW